MNFKSLPINKIIVYSLNTIIAVLVFSGVLLATGVSNAQKNTSVKEIQIDLNFENDNLITVFQKITKETGLEFIYNKKEIKDLVKFNQKYESQSLYEVLLDISESANLQFKQINKNINVQTRFGSEPQEEAVKVVETVDISGKITDENGQGLPGASIVQVGTAIGTTSDLDGNYKLSVAEGATLKISFVGYMSKEIVVGSESVLDIQMEVDAEQLEEVVVIGYGSVKKSDLTGSVVSVDAEELGNMPSASIDQSLVGRAAGVQVTTGSGMPGAIASVRIRGSNSIQGGNEPLYVIDGYPVYNGGGFGNTGSGTRYSGLATLNPSEIESIEVLKDASATSIYGARGANGVVLITTKNGEQGKDRVTFESYFGVQSVVKKIDMMNNIEYATLINEAWENDGETTLPYSSSDLSDIQSSLGTDWQDEVFRASPMQNYQLTFSGGDKKGTYYLSGNYFNQQGTVIGSDFKRYSARFNLRRNVLQNVKIGTNVVLSRTIANASPSSVIRGALLFNPVQPVYVSEIDGIYTKVNSPGATNVGNPVATANEETRRTATNRIFGNFFAEWELLPGLKLKSSYGIDLVDRKIDLFSPGFLQEVVSGTEASIDSPTTVGWLNENTLTYSRQVNDHSFTILGGITLQEEVNSSVRAFGNGFVTDKLGENDLDGANIYEVSSSQVKSNILSYLGRVNYDFQGKYLLTASVRVDGSSRFGKNNKYAVFPSGAFKWRLIEEDFINSSDFFSDLGLRVSYGFTGNQEIGSYRSIPTLDNGETTIARTVVTTFSPDIIANSDLKWEKTGQFDVGIDVGVFNNRLRFTADYYNKKTTDLLYQLIVPRSTGFSSVLQNIGSVGNKGIELSISSDIVQTSDFKWGSSFNISFNNNEVLDLGGDQFKDVGSSSTFSGTKRRIEIGKPMGLFYGFVSDGLFRSQAELDAGPTAGGDRLGGPRLKDLSGPDGTALDGVITPDDDRTYIGDPNPDFYGGLSNNISYKGFEASIFLQYVHGNDIYNDTRAEMSLTSGNHNAIRALVDRWTPNNTNAEFPSASSTLSGVFSSDLIEDGSYLKLRTFTLAYNFPNLKVKHIDGLKVYFTGQNLLTFTNYSGFDPEVNDNGVTTLEAGEDDNTYPQSKTFMLGIRLNLK